MEASDESWGCEVKLAWNLTPCRAEASACGAEGQPRLHGVTLSISVLDIRSPKIACVHYLTSLLIEALVIISGQWPRWSVSLTMPFKGLCVLCPRRKMWLGWHYGYVS